MRILPKRSGMRSTRLGVNSALRIVQKSFAATGWRFSVTR